MDLEEKYKRYYKTRNAWLRSNYHYSLACNDKERLAEKEVDYHLFDYIAQLSKEGVETPLSEFYDTPELVDKADRCRYRYLKEKRKHPKPQKSSTKFAIVDSAKENRDSFAFPFVFFVIGTAVLICTLFAVLPTFDSHSSQQNKRQVFIQHNSRLKPIPEIPLL